MHVRPLRLFLVRHGQTSWNVERRILGRTDIPLDAVGGAQAEALALVLPRADALYASPLTRARATAAALGLPVSLMDTLVEMDQGDLEGLDAATLMERHGALVEAWRADPDAVGLPGAEHMRDVQARGMAGLADIRQRHPEGGTVAVVTHQLWLSATLCGLAGEPLRRWRAWTHRNTAWAELWWEGEHPRVLRHDVAPHLDA